MILGIDLGTSNSMAAVYKDGMAVLIESSTGSHAIPSVVSVDDEGRFFAGDVAKERKLKHAEQTVDMFKPGMGTARLYKLGEKELKADELSAILLKGIKADAERFTGEVIKEAVISVPAFFTNPQRQAVIRAGELAGLKVKRIINEPTAAAMAYGVNSNVITEDKQQVIAVLDLGGGTFDISVMEINDNVMEVVAICGDNSLGGNDFTRRLTDIFINKNNITKKLSSEENAYLWKKAEQAKKQISLEGYAKLEYTIDENNYSLTLTEEEFRVACFDLLEKIRKLTLQAIHESKYESYEIDDIILVGGGTKLSIVRKMIESMADKKLEYKINPDEAVAIGAALQGAFLEHDEGVKELVMTDVCPYYILTDNLTRRGLDFRIDKAVYIEKNTTIPTKKTHVIRLYPSTVASPIIQSSDIYGTNAITVGRLQYNIPETVLNTYENADTIKSSENDDNGCEVHINISYDCNGIIQYEVYIPENDMTYKAVFSAYENTMDSDSISMLSSQAVEINNRENDIDAMVIARAERVYSEAALNEREKISMALSSFEAALKAGKITQINRTREQLTYLLDKYDHDIL